VFSSIQRFIRQLISFFFVNRPKRAWYEPIHRRMTRFEYLEARAMMAIDLSLGNSAIAENSIAGSTVGFFSSNVTNTSYEFAPAPSGTNDNAKFALTSDGYLTSAEAFDFESQASYTIHVRGTDTTNLSDTAVEAFTINVTDVKVMASVSGSELRVYLDNQGDQAYLSYAGNAISVGSSPTSQSDVGTFSGGGATPYNIDRILVKDYGLVTGSTNWSGQLAAFRGSNPIKGTGTFASSGLAAVELVGVEAAELQRPLTMAGSTEPTGTATTLTVGPNALVRQAINLAAAGTSSVAGATITVQAGAHASGAVSVDKENLTFNVASGITGFTGLTLATGVSKATLTGTGAANLTGNNDAGGNTLTGNSGTNTLLGLAGNDRISGGAGSDTIDGGTGTDTAVFTGSFGLNGSVGDYSITLNAGGGLLLSGGPEGSVVVQNVEVLEFVDRVVRVVDTTGAVSSYTTIAAAVSAAGTNDLILVLSGTYTESVTLNVTGLELRSLSGAASTTITSSVAPTVTIGGTGVRLSDMTLSNTAVNGTAVAVGGSTNAKVQGNVFSSAGRGVDASNTTTAGLTVSGNTFSSLVSLGIDRTSSVNFTQLSGNTFNSTPQGIRLGTGVSVAGYTLDTSGIFTCWQRRHSIFLPAVTR